MNLEKAFLSIIKEKGLEAVSSPSLYEEMNNLKAFGSSAERRIVSAMVECGYLVPLLQEDGYDSQRLFTDIKRHLVEEEGFQAELVEYVVDCLQLAIDKCDCRSIIPIANHKEKDVIGNDSQVSSKDGFRVEMEGERFLVTLNNQSYVLDEIHYKAVIRKKDMPIERLKVWIESYVDDMRNNNT